MDPVKEFKIPYVGLKVGKHSFEFHLDSPFFEIFEQGEVKEGDVHVHADLERKANMLVFDFRLYGEVNSFCDRCGAAMSLPVTGEERLIVKFGDETGNMDDEILVLGPAEHEVDLSQVLYEYLHLLLPVKRTHHDELLCDQEMLDKLKDLEVRDEQETDPRWEVLKKLSDK